MHLAYTPEQEALAQELRGYFAGIVTDEVAEAMAHGDFGHPVCLEAVRQMGADNWLAVMGDKPTIALWCSATRSSVPAGRFASPLRISASDGQGTR